MIHSCNIRTLWVASIVAIATAMSSCNTIEDIERRNLNAEHTMIFYLVADNNLDWYMERNVEDVDAGVIDGILPTSRVVVYYDSADTTYLLELGRMPYGSNDYIKYAKRLKTYPKQYSTDPQVMKSVLADIKEFVPSRSYGLVLSGHGTGWFPKPSSGTNSDKQRIRSITGAEYDFTPAEGFKLTRWFGNDYDITDYGVMTAADIADGLSDIKLDYIIFDACFMSSIELLYELRNTTHYIMASPTEIMAAGFPFKHIVPMILNGRTDLEAVAQYISDVYRYSDFGSEHSLSIALVDCSKLDALATAAKRVYAAGVNAVDPDTVQPLESMSSIYDKTHSLYAPPHAFYDMNDYVSKLCTDEALYSDYLKAFDDAVVFADNTKKIYSAYGGYIPVLSESTLSLCGVSCYIPNDKAPVTKSLWQQTEWAKAIGADR